MARRAVPPRRQRETEPLQAEQPQQHAIQHKRPAILLRQPHRQQLSEADFRHHHLGCRWRSAFAVRMHASCGQRRQPPHGRHLPQRLRERAQHKPRSDDRHPAAQGSRRHHSLRQTRRRQESGLGKTRPEPLRNDGRQARQSEQEQELLVHRGTVFRRQRQHMDGARPRRPQRRRPSRRDTRRRGVLHQAVPDHRLRRCCTLSIRRQPPL